MKLNEHDLIGLRRLADDAQLEGKFDDAETLRELLDDRETLEEIFNQDPEVQSVHDVTEAIKGFTETKETVETLGDALEEARSDFKSEAGNFDDVQISLSAEVDRLETILPSAVSPEVFATLQEVRVNLEDVVSTLRGQRDRLQTLEKEAAKVLKEAGR